MAGVTDRLRCENRDIKHETASENNSSTLGHESQADSFDSWLKEGASCRWAGCRACRCWFDGRHASMQQPASAAAAASAMLLL